MNILAMGAHFDDVELGCGASLKRLRDEGHTLYIFVGTNSGFVSASSFQPLRSGEQARAEGQLAADALGAELICGGFSTFDLDYAHKLNTQVTQIIEQNHIDWVFTHWTGDPHHDHWGLSHATLHGAKHVKRVLAYASNWYEGETGFTPDFFIDVTDQWEFKMELLRSFKSEFERVGEKWVCFCASTSALYGLKNGCRYAEGFRCIRWLY